MLEKLVQDETVGKGLIIQAEYLLEDIRTVYGEEVPVSPEEITQFVIDTRKGSMECDRRVYDILNRYGNMVLPYKGIDKALVNARQKFNKKFQYEGNRE